MAAINVEKDGKRAQRDPVWEFCDATCARVCTRTHTQKRKDDAESIMTEKKVYRISSLLLKSESRLHKLLSKAPMMTISVMQSDSAMTVGVLQRFFFFFFKAFGIQATQKMQDKKLVQI